MLHDGNFGSNVQGTSLRSLASTVASLRSSYQLSGLCSSLSVDEIGKYVYSPSPLHQTTYAISGLRRIKKQKQKECHWHCQPAYADETHLEPKILEFWPIKIFRVANGNQQSWKHTRAVPKPTRECSKIRAIPKPRRNVVGNEQTNKDMRTSSWTAEHKPA